MLRMLVWGYQGANFLICGLEVDVCLISRLIQLFIKNFLFHDCFQNERLLGSWVLDRWGFLLLFYISHGYGSESTKSVSQPLPGADGTADRLWVTELRSLCLYTPPSTGLSCCPSQGLQRWPPVGKVSRALQSAPSPNHAAAGEERGGTPCSSWDLSWSSKASGPGFGRRQVGKKTKHGQPSMCSEEEEQPCAHFLFGSGRGDLSQAS